MLIDLLLTLAMIVSILSWVWVLFVLIGVSRAMPVVKPGARGLPPDPPSLTVILPVRNEERNIEECLRSLRAQTYPDLRVIVLDDCSTDSTGTLARAVASKDDRVTVLAGESLPPGWIGKNWANCQAVRHARGEWLLFTDADIRLHPEAISGAVALALETRADMLGLVPLFECRSFWEKVLQPAVATLIGVARPAFLVNDPNSKVAISTGGFLLIRGDVYEAVGGHAAVRAEIVDDQALAMLVKGRGHRLLLADGMAVMSVRMYHGFRELWAGWRKNIYEGSGGRPEWAAIFLTLLFTTSILPVVALVAGLFGAGGAAPWLAVVSLLLMLLVRIGGNIVLKVPPGYALLHPLAALMLGGIYISSFARHYSGKGQEWKGRVYPDMGQ